MPVKMLLCDLLLNLCLMLCGYIFEAEVAECAASISVGLQEEGLIYCQSRLLCIINYNKILSIPVTCLLQFIHAITTIYLTDSKVFGPYMFPEIFEILWFCDSLIDCAIYVAAYDVLVHGQLAFNVNFKIDQALYIERLLFSGELLHTCTHYMRSAPVPGTVEDFWQMIWDQNIGLVVKLTKNVEGTLKKVYCVCILC